MHDHNLDDLIIDNIEPKNSKTKSFLTIIALLIVVLIVAIILTKILLKTPDKDVLAFEEDTTELIAPELQLKEVPKPQEVKEEPSLSDTIESKPQAPVVEAKETEIIEKTDTVIEKEVVLSNIEDQEVEAPVAQSTETIVQKSSGTQEEQEAKNASDIAYWKKVQAERKAEKLAYEAQGLEIPPVVANEEKTEEAVQPRTVKTAKPVVTPVKQPEPKPVATKPVPKAVPTGRYYVQVGAYREEPDARFMSVIRNNGYHYIMTEPNRSGLKKLLIGPYRDRASVERALRDIQDRVHKSAFITTR
jgi:DedD protein